MPNTGLYNNFGMATLYDVAQRLGKGNKEEQMLGKVVELQAQTNDIWTALPFQPCNNGTSETVMVRTSLPDVAWRIINRGVKPTKSSVGQASFTTGGVEALANIDERIINLRPDANQFRMNENYAHQEAMSQKMSTTIFYGDEKVNPAGFTGLSAFYYSKKDQDAVYADQIIDAGGTGNKLTSLWIITFAPDTVYGIHPKSIAAGYKYRDNGRIQVPDKDNNMYWAYQSQMNWDMGLCIRDPRYVVRLANIDVTKTTDAEFLNKLITAYNQIENPDHGRTFILCNRQVQTYLAILAANKQNVNLGVQDFAGKKITHFWTSPILRNDAILNTESQLI